MSAFEVDLAELDAVVADLAACTASLAARVGELDAAAIQARRDWTGETAEAQAGAHRRILTGARELHAGLVGLQRAAHRAHSSYAAAQAANDTTWRHLG